MLIYLLIGALLAQRFKVLVLVPAIALTIVSAITLGFHYGYSAWQILVDAIEGIVCLQVGYLGGAGINYLFAGVLAGSLRHRTLDGSVSHRRAH